MILFWSLIILNLASVVYSDDLPRVKSIDCDQLPQKATTDYTSCLEVAFSSGVEYAGLTGSATIMTGYMLKPDGSEDTDGSVSVTKDDEKTPMALVAIDFRDTLYSMKVNLATGEGEKEKRDESFDFEDAEPHNEFDTSVVPTTRKLMNKSGYKMRVQFVCDSSCKKNIPNHEEEIKKITVHANTFFAHKSLGTRIKLEPLPTIKYIPDYLVATIPNLNAFGKIVQNSNWPDADSYALITKDISKPVPGQSFTVGIAQKSATCSKNKGTRVSINEYHGDALVTAKTLVHEIGHNLGMSHDFITQDDGSRTPRVTSDKQQCTGVGGYMDYFGDEIQWSKCSKEDIQKYHDIIENDNGGCFCLDYINGQPCKQDIVQPFACADNYKSGTCKDTTKCGNSVDHLVNCFDSCGKCPLGANTCQDNWSNCAELVSDDPDLCKFGESDWRKKTRTMCRKSCNLCKKVSQKPFPKRYCKDISKTCDKSKCSTGAAYQEECMATCGYCRDGPATCRDRYSNCKDLVDDDVCKYMKTDWARGMRLSCRSACNLCLGKPKKPKKLKPVACVDRMRPKGSCDKTKCNTSIDYKDKCMATCGLCSYGPNTCHDAYSNCPSLVSTDSCNKSKNIRMMCRKSCNKINKICRKVKQRAYPKRYCVDRQKNCDKSKCSTSIGYKEKCMATCGFCPKGKNSCIDRYGNCASLTSNKDICKYLRTDWGRQMRVYCRKSCSLCK